MQTTSANFQPIIPLQKNPESYPISDAYAKVTSMVQPIPMMPGSYGGLQYGRVPNVNYQLQVMLPEIYAPFYSQQHFTTKQPFVAQNAPQPQQTQFMIPDSMKRPLEQGYPILNYGKEVSLLNGIGRTRICTNSKLEGAMIFGSVSHSGRISDEHKYKTEMCKNWIEKGFCHYEHKCRFAHGTQEMKERFILNQKYRSKPCQEFHNNLYCSYGVRCLFYHGEYDKNDIHLNQWALNDSRIKILQLALAIEKLLYSSLDLHCDKTDILNSIQNQIMPKKSKFGFNLEQKDEDDSDMASLWTKIKELIEKVLKFIQLYGCFQRQIISSMIKVIALLLTYPLSSDTTEDCLQFLTQFVQKLTQPSKDFNFQEYQLQLDNLKTKAEEEYFYSFNWDKVLN